MLTEVASARDWRRWCWRLLLLLSCLAQSGCSGFGLLFERLDLLTLWQADRMLDLDDAQEAALEPGVIELREWLRGEGLPAARTALASVEARWAAGDLEGATEQLQAEGKALGVRFLDQAWPRLAPVMARLEQRNLSAYEAYSEERMVDWFASSKSSEAKLQRRIDRLEDWFGDLSDEQIAIVQSHGGWREDEYDLRVANSRQWRQRVGETILARDMARLESLFKHPEQLQSPAYQTWLEEQQAQFRATFKELFPTLTPAQRDHARDRVLDWIDNLASVEPSP